MCEPSHRANHLNTLTMSGALAHTKRAHDVAHDTPQARQMELTHGYISHETTCRLRKHTTLLVASRTPRYANHTTDFPKHLKHAHSPTLSAVTYKHPANSEVSDTDTVCVPHSSVLAIYTTH